MIAMAFPPSVPAPVRRRRFIATALGLTPLLLAGAVACGDDEYAGPPGVATVEPATPGIAVTGTPAPVGTVLPAPDGETLVLGDQLIAALDTEGSVLTVFNRADPALPTSTVTVPPLTSLIADGDGFLGVTPGALVFIDADGQVREAQIPTADPLSVALSPTDDQVLVGTADGRLMIYSRDGELAREIRGFVRVDQITVAPEGADLAERQVAVLDLAQSAVIPVDISDGELLAALRAGNGAGQAVVDHYGRILVSGTRDDEIYGFFGQPLVMRFRYPMADSPYAVGFDQQRNLLWVTATEDNSALAFDLGTGVPEPRYRIPTVMQPDALTVDSESGTVYVLSADGAGLQVAPVETQEPAAEGGR